MAHRFVGKDGELNVVRRGLTRVFWADLYHWLIDLRWRYFWALLITAYVSINAIFALLYMLGGECIHGADPSSFTDHFFFSIQSVATIGYGAMYPKTVYADALVAVESFVGLVITALSTGLVFARFSRPTARVMFSDWAVIHEFNGLPTLMFRIANIRGNQIVDAGVSISFVRSETTVEGESFRMFDSLELRRSRTPMFALSWTVMHVIDESSLLYGLSEEEWRSSQSELIVSLSGVDGTFGQMIHARHSYTIDQIATDQRLADILTMREDGVLEIDFERFHELAPLD